MEHFNWADHSHPEYNEMNNSDHHSLYNDFTHVVDDLEHLGTNDHDLRSDLMGLIEDMHHPFDSEPHMHEMLRTVGSLDEHLPQFDMTIPHQNVLGHPIQDMTEWHLQHHDDTCAIASQEFILNALTGQHVSEETLCQEASQHGWYVHGGGTPLEHVGDLLALHGIPVEHHYGTTLAQLETEIQTGHEVIVCLNGEKIWSHHHTDSNLLNGYLGIPGQGADHAVEVIGIDAPPDHEAQVILNDPGHPDGKGLEVPLSQFMEGWSTSDNYMVSTSTNMHHGATASAHNIGGYYNADNTYHYISDNTDRDPQTGAVIRRW